MEETARFSKSRQALKSAGEILWILYFIFLLFWLTNPLWVLYWVLEFQNWIDPPK